MLADGDGEAGIDPAADGDHGVGIEAAVGTHGELPAGPAVANPAHRFTQEVGGAGRQRVIALGTGVAVVAGALLGQSVGLPPGQQCRPAPSGHPGLAPGSAPTG